MPNYPPSIDQHQRRCPRLGHSVHFSYCRKGGDDRGPCFKVFDCWWEQFDVVAYFKQHLTRVEFDKLQAASPPNKVTSLVDLIQQARKRSQSRE